VVQEIDVRGHLWPEDDETTRAAVEAVLGPRVPQRCHGEAVAE
jgi:hypothetical protein